MMERRTVLVPLLALASTLLSGCVAAAIPAIAGSAMFGTRIDGKDAKAQSPAASASMPAVAAAAPRPAPAPAPAPNPHVTVLPGTSAPSPAATEAPAIAPTPVVAATPVMTTAGPVAPVAVAAPTGEPIMAAPAAPAPVASAPDGLPRPEQFGFAQFVRYGRGVAAVSAGAKGPLSAMLSDPIALDGQRKRCAADEQPVAVIDLDPAGGLFAPPADPERDVRRALGLAVLREAGVKIAWLSDLPVAQIGAVRNALEFAGLDPRGEDIVSLRRDPDDRKQARKETLAATSCIIAIAGDSKPDFDERFQYLKNPEAGAALETAIGDGWFLIEPIFPPAN
ncbi:MAG: hypothetical protein ACK4IC_09375 [Erythrobacter sp.]